MVTAPIRAPARDGNDGTRADSLTALTRPPSFPGLERVTASVDTLAWWDTQHGLTPDQDAQFKSVGTKVWQRNYFHKDRRYRGTRVSLSNVGRNLNALLEWLALRPARPNRIDIAFDLHFADRELMWQAHGRMRLHLVMDHAPNAQFIDYENGNFDLKDWSREVDDEGKPIGKKRRVPARSATIYAKDTLVLRVELKFHSPASIEKHLPALTQLHDVDAHAIWLQHLRWRTYRPRVLARKRRTQVAKAALIRRADGEYRPYRPVNLWPNMLRMPDSCAKDMTTVAPLDLGVAIIWS